MNDLFGFNNGGRDGSHRNSGGFALQNEWTGSAFYAWRVKGWLKSGAKGERPDSAFVCVRDQEIIERGLRKELGL